MSMKIDEARHDDLARDGPNIPPRKAVTDRDDPSIGESDIGNRVEVL